MSTIRVYLPYIVQAPDDVSKKELAAQIHLEFALGMRPLRPHRGIRLRRDVKISRRQVAEQLDRAEYIETIDEPQPT